MFQNYHRHSYYSNVIVPDVVVSNEDYAIRATELGHGILSGVEHGYQGRYIESYELAKKYNLKFVFGTEAYIVKNRLEKDKTNAHIILLAKNENGRRNINRILSDANLTGFYYRPRIDLPLLLSLPSNDVWVTSACVGGLWKYEDADEIMIQLSKYFGRNFYLEVQNHNTESQRNLNRKIINLANRNNINIIFGCDSHFISSDQFLARDDYLLSKHVQYEDEEHWFMDYPDNETVLERFKEQGVLTHAQIDEAISNTNVLLEVEEYTGEVFKKTFKIPSLYPDYCQEDKDNVFTDLIWKQWEIEKINVPKIKWKQYENEIQKELDVIIETKLADYFLLDYNVVNKGKELGGFITMTGRGSAPSFYLSKLLGLTTIDRIGATVKLFPERFITKERILEAGTLPDIDLNLGNPEIFAQAQIEVMGENHSYPMLAYGTLQPKAAWKLYARAKNIDFDTANMVSSQIDQFEMDYKHTEDEEEKQLLDVMNYIEEDYKETYYESTKYLGIVSDWKIHPCAYLLYAGDIKEEIGLIKIKEHLCSVMDGLWAENYKFLKNDLLKVSVVDLIFRIYKRIGIQPHTLPELIKLCENDQKTWDVYKNAWTMGINQVEQHSTSGRVAKYAPKNISELSAFVAAVRPGFKSNYKQFESREPFCYGIDSLDNIIQTKEFPQSYLIYQENSMQAMAYAGIPISETYEIVKNIAKKRAEKVFKYKEQFINGMTKKVMQAEKKTKEEATAIADMTWKVIEDSSRYSFNACVSGNTIIDKAGIKNGRFIPTIEEMFMIKNDREYARTTGHFELFKKYKLNGYGNALSMYDDERIRKNKIINIYQSGIRDTFKITMSKGSYIICTDNHKFPTPNGTKHLSELLIGDYLFIRGKYQINNKKHNFTDGNFVKNFPIEGQQGFQSIPDGASVVFHEIRNQKIAHQSPCEICGRRYDENKRFELHHKDEDRTNNDPENLTWCCVSCHKKEHYKSNRVKVYEKGIPTELDQVISIEYVSKEMVYDIEMDDPAHNFITDNGLVTSNSHAYSVAGDSLYGAYLKSHYPFEFYETFLQILEADGDKDRLSAVKNEAQSAFHIIFPPYRFGQDNRTIVAKKETNEILSSLTSIKGFGSSIGENMYELGKLEYRDFVDFLIYVEEHDMNTKKIIDLISINYFEKFGNNKKLKMFYDEFEKGDFRYSKTHKDKTKQTRIEELKKIWDGLPNLRLSVYDQIMAESDILGYVQVVYPHVNKQYVYVKELSEKFAPRIEAYCLATGKSMSLKIQKKVFENNNFLGGEILYCKHFEKKPSVKFVDGKYQEIENEFTWWISNYSIVTPENFDSII